MNPNLMQLLAAMSAQQAPAPAAPATPAPSNDRQTFKVTRGVNAFKSVGKGFNKDRWMMSAGDLTVRWNGAVIPKSAFVKGEHCLVTKTQWEITFGVTGGGRVYAISAVDTKVPTASGDTLDDVEGETLDDVGSNAGAETAEDPL